MPPSKANRRSLIVELVVVALLVGVGVYAGFKWGQGPPPPPIDTHKIDSLNAIVLNLEDSIKQVRGRTDTLTKVIIKYRTRYENVTVRTDAKEIVASLKKTAARPIK
jgi:hypothetical protein